MGVQNPFDAIAVETVTLLTMHVGMDLVCFARANDVNVNNEACNIGNN